MNGARRNSTQVSVQNAKYGREPGAPGRLFSPQACDAIEQAAEKWLRAQGTSLRR